MSSYTEEQALVAQANLAFYRAFETLDLARMQTVWLRNDEVCCIHPGAEPHAGWDEVMKGWSLVMRHTPRLRFELDDVAVVVNGGIGWVQCLERIYDGETLVGTAATTNLFQQNREGRWLMVLHHASPRNLRVA